VSETVHEREVYEGSVHTCRIDCDGRGTFRRLLRGVLSSSSASAGGDGRGNDRLRAVARGRPPRPTGFPRYLSVELPFEPVLRGRGVYVKYLSRALTDLGHSVDVLSGKAYPDLDDDVGLVKLPGENVVDELDRLGQFEPSYLRDPLALYEWLSALTGGFPDPLRLRAAGRRLLRGTPARIRRRPRQPVALSRPPHAPQCGATRRGNRPPPDYRRPRCRPSGGGRRGPSGC